MTKDELKRRTRRFALDVIHLVESLPRTRTAEVIGRQLPRSATSVGANYRAACRARSSADFVSRMGIVEEEADESMYWMELLMESGGTTADAVAALRAQSFVWLPALTPTADPRQAAARRQGDGETGPNETGPDQFRKERGRRSDMGCYVKYSS